MKILVLVLLALSLNQAFCSESSASDSNKIDILFIIDNSTNMRPLQAKLASYLIPFVEDLNTLNLDYHIAVTTMDQENDADLGLLIGIPAVITPLTPNAATNLEERINLGEKNHAFARGFSTLTRVISRNYKTSFVRDDAKLIVIFLSRGNDRSTENIDELTEELNQIKPGSWSINYIGSTDMNCPTLGNYADLGVRYLDLVHYSNGSSASICNDSWDPFFNEITEPFKN